MSKQFAITLTSDAHEVVDRFKATAQKNNFQFSGNERLGQFSGKGIEGQYAIKGNLLTITIGKKPMLIPWSLIESTVRDFFA